MNAQELRIGNYISVNNCVQEVVELPLPINCTDENTHPLPLSAYWLLKFGWGADKEYYNTFIDNQSMRQEVLFYDVSSKMLLIETNSDMIEISHIRFVHQLQNLYFALTGKELEI